ncbi:unnamed protein product, partial [Callosobruchus maculatus]
MTNNNPRRSIEYLFWRMWKTTHVQNAWMYVPSIFWRVFGRCM